MAKMLSLALNILLLDIVLLTFASTSMPQTTNSDHELPLSRFQPAASSQVPIMVIRSSRSQLPTILSSSPLAESQQLSSDSDEEKKEEEKKKKEEEKERKKEEKEKKKEEEKERKKEEKEKKEEEKERKKEEKEKEKEKEEQKKKNKKDCSVAISSVKQSNIGVTCMVISLALFFYI
ncbi:hypothetical protein CRYUN_Cryun23aG0021100 [Craigia yunnanensis]